MIDKCGEVQLKRYVHFLMFGLRYSTAFPIRSTSSLKLLVQTSSLVEEKQKWRKKTEERTPTFTASCTILLGQGKAGVGNRYNS